MRLIKQIWYLFSRRNRFKAISLYFLILFNVFLEILSIGSIVPILIFFLDKENIETIYIVNFIFSFLNIEYSEKAFFNLILISIFSLYLMKSITLILQFYLESNLSWNVIHDVRKNLFEKYLLSEMTYHNNIHTSTIINNLSKELNFAFHAVSNLIQIFSQFTLSIIICLTLIIFKPAEFFIIFFLILGTLLIYNFFTSKNLKRLSTSRQTTEEKVTRFIINGLGGIRELKVFNTEKTFLKIFNDIAKKLIKISKKMHIYISLPKLILEMIIVSAILIMLYNFVGKDFNTSYILTTAGVFTLASIKLLPSISKIYHGYQSFKINTPSVEIIFDDLQDLKKVKNQRDKKFNTKLIFLKNLILKDISFNYGKKQIFNKANLTINRLEFLGIKGESGVGKSTLIDLILGLKEAHSGKILIDGNNLTNGSLKNQIGYVPQDIFLMDDTIKNNIIFNFKNETLDQNKFEKACKDAEIYNVFENLPKKFESNVGERGSKISIGQRQRIGLARALYREPDLLILDEVTSSLDLNTKNKILQTIIKINKQVTVIMISHDNDILKNCQRVVEVKNKKIIEINIS